MPNFAADKLAAAVWARDVLAHSGWYCILDAETTGLGENARVCQIAIISLDGEVFLDTLIDPRISIPPEATAIHGITDEMVKDAPPLTSEMILGYGNFLIYNAAYDLRILEQHGLICDLFGDCVMEQYAKFIGDWNDYHKSYRWQKLPAVKGYQAHSALGDCFATLALIKQMAAYHPADDIPF